MKIQQLLLILMVFIYMDAASQTHKIFNGDTINRTDAKGLKQGEWSRYYDNDQLFSKTTYKNGKAVGTTFTYYKSGEKQGELIHDKDGKTARMTSYWPNGKIKAVGKYMNQKKDSVWNYFNEKEILTILETYKAGKPEGTWKVFYADGKISEETLYANGKKNGAFTKYFPNGNKKTAGTYKNDSLEGTVMHYHLNGKPYIKGNFLQGLKQGEWLYMNESGFKDSVEVYNKGVLQM